MVYKSIVFDLDNTIGFFKQFIYILNSIHIDKKDNYLYLFDLFPEYFRPNIFELFQYIINVRKKGKINSIILYSNNNNEIFVNSVIEYINTKLTEPLFNTVITSNTNGRKYTYKHIDDLLNCSDIQQNYKICFIDDKKHINMINSSIFYIECEKYQHYLSDNEINHRLSSTIHNKIIISYIDKKRYNLNINNQKRVTEQIWKRIQHFIQYFA